MNSLIGRKTGGLFRTRFAVAALAFLVCGRELFAAVDNGTGATVSAGQAVLRGNLTGSTSDIYIYWGLIDGGQSTNYEHVVKLANVPAGAFSTNVAAACGFTYHYICLASNAGGAGAWATSLLKLCAAAVRQRAHLFYGVARFGIQSHDVCPSVG